MITARSRAGRGVALAAALLASLMVAGCQSTGPRGDGEASQPVDPEQARLASAPAAERQALAVAQREAEATAGAVVAARRMVDRRALEAALATDEAVTAKGFARAARTRADLAREFGAEAGLDSAPVLSLLERAESFQRQAEARETLAAARAAHARTLVPVAEARAEVARRKVDVARERALAATRPGVEQVAYPPLADAQASLAGAEAALARAEAQAIRRQAEVETATYALARLGAPVTITAVAAGGAWPALTVGPAPQTGQGAPAAAAPAATPQSAPAAPAASPPALTQPTQGGAVVFEPSGNANKPR
jgi:hypothetical protein